MKRSKKKVIKRRKRPACGLCGSKSNLTRTECCRQWICDDSDEYVPFSYARNSCYRNHSRFTLCGYHFNEEHEGDWKDCKKCREDLSDNMEMYVDYGINEYNFEKLPNPPEFELTYCSQCGERIVIGDGGYSTKGDTYTCQDCKPLNIIKPPAASDVFDDFEDDDLDEGFPYRLTADDADDLPDEMYPRFEDIATLINDFCEEYKAFAFGILCMDMNLSLCVQFPEIVSRGKVESWAGGIVHALALINFLTDPSSDPYISTGDIKSFFGVSQGTIQSKSKQIRDLLETFQMDPIWCLPELILENPMLWMVEVDGIMMDIRHAPLETQQKAVDQGLIPMLSGELEQNIAEYEEALSIVTGSLSQQEMPAEPVEEDGHKPNIRIVDYMEPKSAPKESLPLFDPPEKK